MSGPITYYFRRYLAAGLAGAAAACVARYLLDAPTVWVYVCAVIAGLTCGTVRDAIEKRRTK